MPDVADYLAGVGAELDLPFRSVRFENAAAASDAAILWRELDPVTAGTLDLDTNPTRTATVLECRSPTREGARAIGDDLLATFQRDGALGRVVDDVDGRDDASGQRQEIFVRVIVAEIDPPAARH